MVAQARGDRGEDLLEHSRSWPVAKKTILWRGRGADGQVALTFDDGPHPAHTARILEILRRQGIKASFFPLGRHAQRHPELVGEIFADGHTIGNHSWNHRHLFICSGKLIREELARSSDIIAEITGQRPRFFRPPWGLLGWQAIRQAHRLGMQTVLWSVSSQDYRRPGADRIAGRVLSRVQPGSIVLLHDAKHDDPEEDYGQTIRALPEIIAGIRGLGFRLVTLAEMVAQQHAIQEVQAR